MYDMTRITANGYFDSMSKEDRYNLRVRLNKQRTEDYRNNSYALTGGLPEKAKDSDPFFVKDYIDYYKTKRGYHPRSLNSNQGWNVTSSLSFLNMPILSYAEEIKSAVLVIHGEKAHSRYMGEDAFHKLTGNNKELWIVPNAVHTDLYDRFDKIPFDRIEYFLTKSLN